MKLLVFLLVLANALFYAFANGYLGPGGNPDAGRVGQQVNPERLRIVSRGEAPRSAVPPPDRPAEPIVPVPAAESADSKPVAPEAVEAKPSEVAEAGAKTAANRSENELPICLVWRQLSPADADRLVEVFGKRFSEFKLARKAAVSESNGWWVSIPPLPGKADVERKTGELRELGVTDFFPVQDGPSRNAISLGIFSTEKGARDRLAELKAKGVRSAVVGLRPGKEESVSLQVRGPAGDRAAVLRMAADTLGKSEPQACK